MNRRGEGWIETGPATVRRWRVSVRWPLSGHSQVQGIGYYEVVAPTDAEAARLASLIFAGTTLTPRGFDVEEVR